MSIIQRIRDKAAWIIIAAIALALIAFIVQDAFQNRNMFGGSSTTMGSVNGKEIDAVDFEEKYKRAEEGYRTQGYPMNDMMRTNIRDGIWGEYVDDAIMTDRYDALGLSVSDKELSDILYGANPPQDLRQQFTDPNTGQYDANAAAQQIATLQKQKNSPQYASFFNQYLPALRKQRQKEKYLSLLSSSVYVPRWMVEKITADNSQKSSITYVNVPYATISDSAVRISDQAINEWVQAHKDDFKQEPSRTLEYVMFDAGPTTQDSAAIYAQVGALKNEFAAAADVQAFLVRNGSESTYGDAFELRSKMTAPNADSLVTLTEGSVTGPYLENENYVLSKMIAKRTMPDSVKLRHILIKTGDQGKISLADSVAKRRIDSVSTAIKGGADFNEMVLRYSDDQGSKQTGGEYDFASSQFGGISKEFAETVFYGVAGDKKTVKVDNQSYSGYHYIEVISQKGFEPAYKIAHFLKAIVPSEETTIRENGLASQFAAESRNKKQFDQTIKSKKYNKLIASDIKPLDGMINGLGSSREVVKWAFEAEPGDVSENPFQVEDKFVVPVLTRVYEEGVMTADKARPIVESILRNKQKASQISSKIGNASTVEAAAKATGQQVTAADSILFSSSFIPNVGQEPKVVGASFHKAWQNKASVPIAGNGGVFVVKINSISAVANPVEVQQQRTELRQNQQRALSDPRVVTEILKKTVKVEDNRYKFF